MIFGTPGYHRVGDMVQLIGNFTHARRSQVEKLQMSLHYWAQMGAGACSSRTRVLQPACCA